MFVVSAGRTATTFFGEALNDIIPGVAAVHEPDALHLLPHWTWRRRLTNAVGKIKQFGWYHMIVGRALGRTGIRNVARRYLAGETDLETAAAQVRKQRLEYFRSLEADIVVEAAYYWFGLLDVIPHVFPEYRILGVVRDPRTWVSSILNLGGHHDQFDVVRRFGGRRVDPHSIEDTRYAARWTSMSSFEKNCWDWSLVARLLMERADQDPNIRLVRYEDLFFGEGRAQHLTDALRFITMFSDRTFPVNLDSELVQRRVNEAPIERFPHWREWSAVEIAAMAEICGPLMTRLGYGLEDEWQSRVRDLRIDQP